MLRKMIEKDDNVAENEVEDDDVAEDGVEVDDVEDDEVKGEEDDGVEEEEGDDDAEEEGPIPRGGTHTFCQPAQSKCTWTCHMREFTDKMPQTKTADHTLCEPV